ncbi:hypothetical protein PCANC_15047 [Puccinia coronata f. sp. avenae]|uniref:Uncharacterized protein n=1 Tax=Puccinia coronata f. sp. avenae TaxID=200324 RepID=A0A2N5U7Y2_9BASI|nr:hypothetical protein PCANC_15047 [Puccinia coronata f. sp. avenae]
MPQKAASDLKRKISKLDSTAEPNTYKLDAPHKKDFRSIKKASLLVHFYEIIAFLSSSLISENPASFRLENLE